MRVVLGVGGGIAAYKACELLRLLTESGHQVRVVPTAAALRFVGVPTWAALSGQPVTDQVWDDASGVPHVRLGQQADLVLVAPATADLLARAAHGHADDLLTNVLLTARCPVLYAPAMHTEMWEHPATAANVATLRSRGALVLEPASGRLTGVDTGKGRLPDPAEIFAVARRVLARRNAADRNYGDTRPGTAEPSGSPDRAAGEARPGQDDLGGVDRLTEGDRSGAGDMRGRHVVVTAGGTREPLDPVRFLGNRSSGKQGYAFARTAAARGAQVTLVAANVSLPDPAGVHLVRVSTTEELRKATVEAAAGADVVVMAAAPADFRPASYSPGKIKKSGAGAELTLHLVATPDIAAELGARKPPGQLLVAFAAETAPEADALDSARDKLTRKRADLIVVNEVGPAKAFGADSNAATVLGADGSTTTLSQRPKEDLADAIWDLVVARLTGH